MSAPQDPFNFSGMATNLAAPPVINAGNQAPPLQYSQPQYQQQQQQHQQHQHQQPPQQQYVQPPQQQQQQQLVVSTQPSNPYAGIVPPQTQQPQPPPQVQQPQASPWGTHAPVVPSSNFVNPPPAMASTASAATFDPFAAPPAPAPAPVVAPAPAPPQQQQQAYYAAPIPPVQDPWAAAAAAPPQSVPASQHQHQQQYQAPAPPTTETQIVPAQRPQTYQNQGQQPSYPNDNNYASNNASYGNNENNRQIVPASNGGNNNDKAYENKDPRNPYSAVLAQQVAGSKASNLPKAHLVGKKGFVLSRISFRTIVMKKWKQSFWVQYGGHTMLWFRTQRDFDDWLNNPYHTQFQRNFLIKLAINFVHDLYKPNVRGYQVTQCRTKPYGKNKVVRQFKLERWMDYGPTIAAAFGSFDPKEVDACREAIVECMKNTPLDNGIRATGAVKEHHDRQQQEEWRKSQEERQIESGQNGGPQQNGGGGGGGGYKNYSLDNNLANGMNGQAPRFQSMCDVDLLGDSNIGGDIDDSASVPGGTSYVHASTGILLGEVGGGALVPAVNPNPVYPGAPPPPVGNYAQPAFYPSAPPQMQQPQYPAPSQGADPSAYGVQTGAPASQAYPGQVQNQQPQYSQQQTQYPVQAPAPAFAQAPQPPQTEYGGYAYPQQPPPQPQPPQMQQAPASGYPAASYPVPTQQF